MSLERKIAWEKSWIFLPLAIIFRVPASMRLVLFTTNKRRKQDRMYLPCELCSSSSNVGELSDDRVAPQGRVDQSCFRRPGQLWETQDVYDEITKNWRLSDDRGVVAGKVKRISGSLPFLITYRLFVVELSHSSSLSHRCPAIMYAMGTARQQLIHSKNEWACSLTWRGSNEDPWLVARKPTYRTLHSPLSTRHATHNCIQSASGYAIQTTWSASIAGRPFSKLPSSIGYAAPWKTYESRRSRWRAMRWLIFLYILSEHSLRLHLGAYLTHL
jgi:hypothetical protein